MPRLSVWMIRAALLYLGAGFTVGALMLSNKGVSYAPSVWLFLNAHIEFLLLGWMAQLAMGVAFWILPRFSQPPKYGNARLAWFAFALWNAGIVAVTVGSWPGSLASLGALLGALGRALEIAGAILFVIGLWPRVKAFAESAAS